LSTRQRAGTGAAEKGGEKAYWVKRHVYGGALPYSKKRRGREEREKDASKKASR